MNTWYSHNVFQFIRDGGFRGLEVSFTKKEVFVALSRFSGEKALRLDGFTWPIRSIVGIL